MNETRVAETADVSTEATIGRGTRIWELAQVREEASIGPECVIGRGVYVDHGVVLGSRCKVQNYALLYAPAALGDGVFIGPAAVLTNDAYPRAIDVTGALKAADDWTADGVTIGTGASIGARAVVMGGCQIGAWALVAAGAVVTKSVSDFALVVGVPARRVGWVGRAGMPLDDVGGGRWRCPTSGEIYVEEDGALAGPR